jgi:hypothetical protein
MKPKTEKSETIEGFKLTAVGAALAAAGKDPEKPQKGIIFKNGIAIDLNDPAVDLSALDGSCYVVKK